MRRAPDDIVYIGEIVGHVREGEFWKVLGFVSASLRVDEIERAKNGVGGAISSDRVLGRIEAYETLISSLEAFYIQKQELQKPIEKKRSVDEGAEEAITTDDLYEPSLNYGGAV